MNLTRRKFFGFLGGTAAVGVAAPFIDWKKLVRGIRPKMLPLTLGPHEDYGRSPGMVALADLTATEVRYRQVEMARRLARAVDANIFRHLYTTKVVKHYKNLLEDRT